MSATFTTQPRPGAPTVHDSSVGGPFLWPADEPWPYCEERHATSSPQRPSAFASIPRHPSGPPRNRRPWNFTLIDITGGNNLQLHVCPSSPYHPHFELLQ
ncbi:hypothetical protein [Streptomyces gardneri]|uniref:hypothetical protein n=1 Tax=Streptomyces gardneri TaxID=66892 RepID=UPI0035DC4AED